MRPSSGIALVVSEGPARPAAATAAPNKIPRVKARRSISLIERLLPYGARVLCGPTVFSRAAPAGSGSRFRYEKMLDWYAIGAIVHDKRMIPASHAAPARAPDKVFPNPSCIRVVNPLWSAFGVHGAMAPNQTWLPPCKDETGDG
jgi:hypothetical protein